MRQAMRNALEVIKFVGDMIKTTPRWLIAAIVIFESIYWTSPKWAQKIGHATWEGTKSTQLAECAELLHSTCKPEILHDGDQPIASRDLVEWTPVRVEKHFESGLTVVSVLGPHGNFQYLVRDLSLPEGRTFRVMNGQILQI